MKKYEILYIVDSSLSDEDRESAIAEVSKVITAIGGKCEEPEKWGNRKYAYPINYKQEGFYVLMNFEADENAPKAVTAKLNINKKIVRHMIVAK